MISTCPCRHDVLVALFMKNMLNILVKGTSLTRSSATQKSKATPLFLVLGVITLVKYYAPIKVLPHLPHAGKRGAKPGD